MNVLIVEDDMLQRKSLRKMIQQIDKGINVYEAVDKDEALEITSIYSIDVFYVDICLNSSSGVDFAIEIRKIPKYEFSFIIFLTTHVEYLTKAFKEVHCYDYILKPYDMAEVVNMTKHFKSHIENINKKPEVKRYVIIEVKSGVNVKIYVDETIFIEVYLRKCMIHTLNGVFKVNNLPLSKILKIINCNNIVQCHKSFAVNVNYIKKIENVDSKLSEIYFENYDENAPLGYKFKNAIMERFQ
ncbi:LytTR family DNA-binding domain-containing protein [Clostridium estertheticum]|uniref:LytR/AlgR family response regulator transcription factor n=1 Tax=Clostridium estertheticum TaxID=238834 RepID=UPI001CF526AE|nr:LytTR family DNA-binding domain-containing protein [Clostridium estertheticum]MCB2308700.1 LytTR family DNA-binding domain-containing protein [Clostridium estertheticum]MCB2347499.1 LytTR family DNA-binding domain-containing protein [Clostridium estertheticum]MCB2351685.1 LytTR family DNA-binding domain-containing protein [Clostridium estertheticum]WAG45351.1 LytTR family DNA-binding domain-containing protein [Clostridium estertheticum]